MKLEFLEAEAPGKAVLLLYEGSTDDVELLRKAVLTLSEAIGRRLAIHELPFVHCIDHCRLTAVAAVRDLGVVAAADGFEWALDQESWLQVADLLEPFREHSGGKLHQYLHQARGPEVIYSTHRGW